MANDIRDLKRRIRSVKNTAQLTRAMKMVSAAKLRRAQEAMQSSRPYADALSRIVADVAKRVPAELHPLLKTREVKAVDICVVTGDKGLCGAFNSNVLKALERTRAEHEAQGHTVRFVIVGKKGVDYCKRRAYLDVREKHQDIFRDISYTFAEDLAESLSQRFVEGESDAAVLVYNKFKSTIAQEVTVRPLVPLADLSSVEEPEETRYGVDYIYEPDAAALMSTLVPRYVAFQLYQAFLESVAAEHGARMAAMENATRSAEDMIGSLTLVMNRARQAAITTELIEVVSGAEAL